MKYSKNYDETFSFYLNNKKTLTFCPFDIPDIKFDPKGVDGKYAFYIFESQGKLLPTKHVRIFKNVFRFKCSLNFHIKMWSESCWKFGMPNYDELMTTFINPPEWVGKHFKNMLIENRYIDYMEKKIEKYNNRPLSIKIFDYLKSNIRYYNQKIDRLCPIKLFTIGLQPNIILKIPLTGSTVVCPLFKIFHHLKISEIKPIFSKLREIKFERSLITKGSKIYKGYTFLFDYYPNGIMSFHIFGYKVKLRCSNF